MESEDIFVELGLSTFTQVWSGDPAVLTLGCRLPGDRHPSGTLSFSGKETVAFHSAAPSPKAYACSTNKPEALAVMSPHDTCQQSH